MKGHYEITRYTGHLWFHRKRKDKFGAETGKWTDISAKGDCSTHQLLGMNGRHAWEIFKKMPVGFVLIKWFFKGRGKKRRRFFSEWEKIR